MDEAGDEVGAEPFKQKFRNKKMMCFLKFMSFVEFGEARYGVTQGVEPRSKGNMRSDFVPGGDRSGSADTEECSNSASRWCNYLSERRE